VALLPDHDNGLVAVVDALLKMECSTGQGFLGTLALQGVGHGAQGIGHLGAGVPALLQFIRHGHAFTSALGLKRSLDAYLFHTGLALLDAQVDVADAVKEGPFDQIVRGLVGDPPEVLSAFFTVLDALFDFVD
jgi:hypothetical protein